VRSKIQFFNNIPSLPLFVGCVLMMPKCPT